MLIRSQTSDRRMIDSREAASWSLSSPVGQDTRVTSVPFRGRRAREPWVGCCVIIEYPTVIQLESVPHATEAVWNRRSRVRDRLQHIRYCDQQGYRPLRAGKTLRPGTRRRWPILADPSRPLQETVSGAWISRCEFLARPTEALRAATRHRRTARSLLGCRPWRPVRTCTRRNECPPGGLNCKRLLPEDQFATHKFDVTVTVLSWPWGRRSASMKLPMDYLLGVV